MSPFARQCRLMRQLGFKRRHNELNPVIWYHPSDVVVQIAKNHCPSAAEVMRVAINHAARLAVSCVMDGNQATLDAIRIRFPYGPLVLERR